MCSLIGEDNNYSCCRYELSLSRERVQCSQVKAYFHLALMVKIPYSPLFKPGLPLCPGEQFYDAIIMKVSCWLGGLLL